MSYYPARPKPVPLAEKMQENFTWRLAQIFDEMGYSETPVDVKCPPERTELTLAAFSSEER